MQNNNVIRLTEGELNQLIETAVKESLNEINWKGIGKGLAKGAAGAALMAGCTAAGLKGLDDQCKYEDEMNRQGAEMNAEPQLDYIEQHGLDPQKTASWEEARRNMGDVNPKEYYDEMHPQQNESRKAHKTISEQRMASIIRENLRKLLA